MYENLIQILLLQRSSLPKDLWLKTKCPKEAQIMESAQNVFDSGVNVNK